jgi:hypothetical protein
MKGLVICQELNLIAAALNMEIRFRPDPCGRTVSLNRDSAESALSFAVWDSASWRWFSWRSFS